MKLSKPLLWLLTLIWFVAGAWWYSHSKCSCCQTSTISPIVTDTNKILPLESNLPTFNVSDGSWGLTCNENLQFGKSSAKPIISSTLESTIDSLANHTLTAKPTKKIVITGYYADSEKNTTSYENLGFARAAAIKNVLLKKGINPQNIATTSMLSDQLYFTPKDTLIGGISFTFENNIEKPKLIEKPDLFKDKTIYFNSGKNQLSLTPELTHYLTEANHYLKTHSDKKLSIIGYTDNQGDTVRNLKLSQARAEFVKSELAKKGIAEKQMTVLGKGKENPIADNNTAEGRAQNRRVTITLN